MREETMNYINILAQAAGSSGSGSAEGSIVPMDLIWQHIISLGIVEALTFISFGIVCLLYGWRIYKILVSISFGLVGLTIAILANRYIEGVIIWLALVSVVLFAVVSIPLMRYGVAALSAAACGILTGGGWLAVGLPEQYIWAGALIGVVAGAMISFVAKGYKISVMLFTSFGGGSLIGAGVLAVLYHYMVEGEKLKQIVFEQKWFLPIMLLIPMALGMYLQNKFIKGAKNWGI
jgi:hypothetical protein